MDRSKISWGLALLAVGVVWLLSNLDVIQFSWMSVFRFWPLIVILVGINIMLPKSPKGNYAYGFFMLLCLAFLVYQGISGKYDVFSWKVGTGGHTVAPRNDVAERLVAEWSDEIKDAKLKIEAGAVSYRLEGGSDELLDLSMPGNSPRHSLHTVVNGQNAALHLKTKSGSSRGRQVSVRLNTRPIWEVELEMGAGSANFDMSTLQVRKLKVETGASSLTLRLGKPYLRSDVSLETGASSTEIQLPKGTSCRVRVESALSSNSLKNFHKVNDHTYESEHFDESADFYTISYEGGLSSFSVNWY